jgi:hypothetical protein
MAFGWAEPIVALQYAIPSDLLLHRTEERYICMNIAMIAEAIAQRKGVWLGAMPNGRDRKRDDNASRKTREEFDVDGKHRKRL